MRPRIVWHIFRKDLVETLRDRRALFTSLVLPLLLYPLLLTGISSFTSNKQQQIEQETARLGVWGPVPARAVEAVLQAKATVVDRRAVAPEDAEAQARGLLEDKRLDVVLVSPAAPQGPSVQVAVYGDSTQFQSQLMQERVLKALRAHDATLLEERMVALGQPALAAQPLVLEDRDVSSGSRRAASLVGAILPYMMLVLLATAAFYSAIDMTAGEKERGTLQTLLTAPVHSLEVVAGKYLAVVTMTLVAALANLTSLGLTVGRVVSVASEADTFHMGPKVAVALFCTLLPAALLLAALFLAVGVLARTYKEGQSYLTPVLLVVLVAAMGSVLPGVELSRGLALVPLTNVALLMRGLLSGRATAGLATLVVVSSFAYAALGVVLAARVFETEQVLLSGERPWKDVLARRRKGGFTPGSSVLFIAVLVLLVFYGSVPLVGFVQRGEVGRAIAYSEVGFFLLPAVAWALLWRVPFREAFLLRLPSRRGVWGTLLLALGGWAVGLLVGSLLERFQGAREYGAQLGELLGKHGPLSLLEAVLLVGVLPAVCEEACFRGVVLVGFMRSGSAALAVVGSAVAFGLFHVNPYHVAAASVLGLVLSYAAYQTQSLLPALLLHAVNNSFQMVAARLGWVQRAAESPWVVAAGLLVTGAGLWLLRGAGRPAAPPPGPVRPAGEVRP